MNLENYKFSVPIQIKMSDLDPFIHVNNGVQCHYFDYGRSCYFEHLLNQNIDWSLMDLVLVHTELDFFDSIEIHDDIICETLVYELGCKSFKMKQQLKDKRTNKIKSTCKSVLSGYDRQTHQSIPISELYRSRLIEFEGL